MAFNYIEDTAVIGTTHYSLAADTTVGVPTAQTTEGYIQVFVEVENMAFGDEYRVRLYEKITPLVGQSLIEEWRLVFPVAKLILPAIIVHNGWDVTAIKISGTDRTLRWSLRRAS